MFGLRRSVGLVRLLLLVLLIILIEVKFSACSSQTLNEYLGFSHGSILFFYVVIWICFAFEIYFLVNPRLVARRSTLILYVLLLVAFLLGSTLTFVGWLNASDGHLITQDDDKPSAADRRLPVAPRCNNLRWIPIVLGYAISLLNSLTILFLMCYED